MNNGKKKPLLRPEIATGLEVTPLAKHAPDGGALVPTHANAKSSVLKEYISKAQESQVT
jgi:hypothetical protein